MRSDDEIKRDVEEELDWEPHIDATDIAVAVKDGVVTLSGFARGYGQRRAAEAAAKRVAGVLGVANDLEVRLPIIHRRPDPEIARDAVEAIKHWLPDSYEQIKVVVKDGWVTLEGDVEWNYQREGAEKAVGRAARGQGHQQPDSAEAAGRTDRDQAQDRGCVPAQREDRRRPDHGRDAGRGGRPQRHGALLGRTAGGRTGGLGRAGRDQGGEPDHDQLRDRSTRPALSRR